jgi:putative nucleotidyltransferase with HDIG domain
MTSVRRTPEAVTGHVLSILQASENTPYIGEPVSQLAHSLQCADQARAAQPEADDETIVAALLHDIGQFVPEKHINEFLGNDTSVEDMIVGNNGSVGSDSSDLPSKPKNVGRIGHEVLGSRYLAALGFSQKIQALVESHVAAKRYLCAVNERYWETLSDASKQSLVFQGGPMTGSEKESFANNPWCEEMCQLRQWDDGAKVIGKEVSQLEQYEALIKKVLEKSLNS